jgi:hypothetical protein
MGDDLRKVRPGDPLRIPARAYNAFVDAALNARRRQQDRRGGELWDGGRSFIGGGVVAVRNDSNADLDRYHALAIDGPLFAPDDDGPEKSFQNRLAFKGIKPTDTTRPGSFAIAREPIPQGEIGLCVVHGVTPVRLLVEDDQHAFADIAPDEDVLVSSGSGGTVILWKEDGTGELWAVVEIGRQRTDRIVAILGEAYEIQGETFRWRYPWVEARIDGDPASDTYGRYVAVENGLSSKDPGGAEDPAKAAFNRYESHHSELPPEEPQGTDGFGGIKSLFVPGLLEPPGGDPGYCPNRAAIPLLRPILKGVAVELTAERDTRGQTVWCFEALNGMELTEQEVPIWLYV